MLLISTSVSGQVTLHLDSVEGKNIYATFYNHDIITYQMMPVFDIFSGMPDTLACTSHAGYASLGYACFALDKSRRKFRKAGRVEHVKFIYDFIFPYNTYAYRHRAKESTAAFLQIKNRKALPLPAGGRLKVVIRLPAKFTKRGWQSSHPLDRYNRARSLIRLSYENGISRSQMGSVSIGADSIYTGCVVADNYIPFMLK